MITYPGARTRAFYLWELNDLKRRRGCRRIAGIWGARRIVICFMFWARGLEALRWWLLYPRCLFNLDLMEVAAPRIEIRNLKGDPHCEGRSLIVLTREDHLNVTLIHELVHSLGYGSPANPHNRAFVLKYCDALAWWFGWDADELRLQAHQWGLI